MGLEYGFRVIPFTCPTASGNFPITIPSGFGLALVPAFVVLFVQRGVTLDVIASSELLGVGALDGTNQFAGAMMSENGQLTAANDSGVRTSSVNCLEITGTAAQGLEAEATTVSLGAGQALINFPVGSVPAAAYKGFAVFAFGADLAGAVTSLTGNPVVGLTSAISGLAFAPDGALFLSWNRAFTNPGAGQDQGMLSVGFAGRLPSTTQACSVVCREDRKATSTSSAALSLGNRCAAKLSSTGGVVTKGATLEVTAWASDGLTTTTRDVAGALDVMVIPFRIGGRKVWAGLVAVDADLSAHGSGLLPFTDSAFRPCTLFSAAAYAQVDGTIEDTVGALSIGCVSNGEGDLEQACISGNLQDGQTTGKAQSLASSSKLVDLVTAAATHAYDAALVSFDPLGWSVQIGTADSLDHVQAVMALEEPPRGVGWMRELQRRRHRAVVWGPSRT